VENISELFKNNKDKLLIVEDWLKSLEKFKSELPFTRIGRPICDAIIIPKCPDVFGSESHHSNMKNFLRSHKLPVANLTNARTNDCVFIGLEDGMNEFDE